MGQDKNTVKLNFLQHTEKKIKGGREDGANKLIIRSKYIVPITQFF